MNDPQSIPIRNAAGTSPIPGKTRDRIAYARFATRGVLTRLALMFRSSERTFTGDQVAEILVCATLAIDDKLRPRNEEMKDLADIARVAVKEEIEG